MAAHVSQYQLINLTATQFSARLTEALRIYASAMRYPQESIYYRAPTWQAHMAYQGWQCLAAINVKNELVGFCYGYQGTKGQWWYEQVLAGLAHAGKAHMASQWLRNYFELAELHVLPSAQGKGLGESLLRGLLALVPQERVLLSTPEKSQAYPEESTGHQPARAWRLYRRMGFIDVLRWQRFAGDPRPFAVLGRTLPLE